MTFLVSKFETFFLYLQTDTKVLQIIQTKIARKDYDTIFI